ncbi:Protein abhd16a [Desmophyllum pertusum]|uniref:Protein abhd16a n=1 Tax=Desmophyllum pertusum TaxID=174260 RepID=A0A9W9ZAF7_9CNID|nr:Protein abhd16a [Desmophyllum pertusum]
MAIVKMRCGNTSLLLIKLLKRAIWNSLNVDVDLCRSMYKSFVELNGKDFPMMLGQDLSEEQRTHLLYVSVPDGLRCRTLH